MPDGYSMLQRSVYVKYLMSPDSGLGLGTDFLNFVQAYSKKKGCKGYFHLYASASYTPTRIPHIFYRKYGMNTENAKTEKAILTLLLSIVVLLR